MFRIQAVFDASEYGKYQTLYDMIVHRVLLTIMRTVPWYCELLNQPCGVRDVMRCMATVVSVLLGISKYEFHATHPARRCQ